jgi:hypothetical protein
MTTIDTPAPALGVGRSLGFILGAVPWPGGLVTRITLAALVPERMAAANSTPFNVTVRTWLRKANTAGRIRRGEHIVQPVDTAHLFAESVRGLGDWRGTDFMDIGQAARWFVGCGAHTAPPMVAERVAREIGWLPELDVSALGQAR